jgi:hypothetical protein
VTALALAVAMPPAYAAPPLPPGKPAGTAQAQIWSVGGIAAIAGGTALVVGFALLIKGGTSTVTPIAANNGNSVLFSPTTTQ